MITHGCFEEHGITISGYLQQAKYIHVLNVVLKGRGHPKRMTQQGELEMDDMLFVLVRSVELKSGKVET